MLIDLIKENGFISKKGKSWQYPSKTLTDTNYADDLALATNTPAQAKSLLHSLEQVAGNIGLNINANKTEFMCLKQEGTNFTLSGKPLKSVD